MDAIAATFGRECLPINLPAADGSRVIDCFFAPDGSAAAFSSPRPPRRDCRPGRRARRGADGAVPSSGASRSTPSSSAPFEQALREGHLVPVCSSPRAAVSACASCSTSSAACPRPHPRPTPAFLSGEGTAAQAVEVALMPSAVVVHVFQIANGLPRQARPVPGASGARSRPTRSSTSATAASPSRSPTCCACRAATQSDPTRGAWRPCAVARRRVDRDAVLHDSHRRGLLPPRPRSLAAGGVRLALMTHQAGRRAEKLSGRSPA